MCTYYLQFMTYFKSAAYVPGDVFLLMVGPNEYNKNVLSPGYTYGPRDYFPIYSILEVIWRTVLAIIIFIRSCRTGFLIENCESSTNQQYCIVYNMFLYFIVSGIAFVS